MNLVIVESPTKARTIERFLGDGYKVTSSYGHVRDLPKSTLGVDVENNFSPKYIIPRAVQKRVTALKKAAAKAEQIILATDEDREGEAIAWHLTQALGVKPENTQRIVFHEITKNAIEKALKHPRGIDKNLVDAQQARRIIDRLVGYKLSPFLWKKIRGGLSAGRVQSVALRLIVEREDEIKKFKPQEYWTIHAILSPAGKPKQAFSAALLNIGNKKLERLDIADSKQARAISADLETATYKVAQVATKETKRNPLPPFTTSTLQQTASARLHFSAKQTMLLAQRLYESGHITYMRTDSVNLSAESLASAKKWIAATLGKEYATSAPRRFKGKSKLAQEAHEAIRPTDPAKTPEAIRLDAKEAKLYALIWQRFIASQLPPARFDATTIDITAHGEKTYTLRATGTVMKFDGFLRIWHAAIRENSLPEVSKDEQLDLMQVDTAQHFTEPPPRYSEATLVKALEEYGIGRPSTYAPIISVIQERDYVFKNSDRRFEPTEIGMLVNAVLTKHFPHIVDVGFTREIEEDFDKIAEGKDKWQLVVKQFYDPFAKRLEKKYEEVKKEDFTEKTDEECSICGKPMVIKHGRFGKFLACSGYPECKNTKSLKEPPKEIGMKCPKCKQGEVIIRYTKRRKAFFGCSRYPDCDFASWTNPLEQQNKPATKQ